MAEEDDGLEFYDDEQDVANPDLTLQDGSLSVAEDSAHVQTYNFDVETYNPDDGESPPKESEPLVNEEDDRIFSGGLDNTEVDFEAGDDVGDDEIDYEEETFGLDTTGPGALSGEKIAGDGTAGTPITATIDGTITANNLGYAEVNEFDILGEGEGEGEQPSNPVFGDDSQFADNESVLDHDLESSEGEADGAEIGLGHEEAVSEEHDDGAGNDDSSRISRTSLDAADAAEDRPDVTVKYNEVEYPLFAPATEDNPDPDGYFFREVDALDEPLSSFLASIRSILAEEPKYNESYELTVRINSLGLEFGETSSPLFLANTTFRQIVNVYCQLVMNDDRLAEPCLFIELVTRSSCTDRLAELVGGADKGWGLSRFTATKSVLQHSEHTLTEENDDVQYQDESSEAGHSSEHLDVVEMDMPSDLEGRRRPDDADQGNVVFHTAGGTGITEDSDHMVDDTASGAVSLETDGFLEAGASGFDDALAYEDMDDHDGQDEDGEGINGEIPDEATMEGVKDLDPSMPAADFQAKLGSLTTFPTEKQSDFQTEPAGGDISSEIALHKEHTDALATFLPNADQVVTDANDHIQDVHGANEGHFQGIGEQHNGPGHALHTAEDASGKASLQNISYETTSHPTSVTSTLNGDGAREVENELLVEDELEFDVSPEENSHQQDELGDFDWDHDDDDTQPLERKTDKVVTPPSASGKRSWHEDDADHLVEEGDVKRRRT